MRSYILGALALASMASFSADTETGSDAPAEGTEQPATAAAEAPKERKSIVPTGWKTKEDELAKFINEQCTGKDGFQWAAFFQLMRENIGGNLTEVQIAKYEGQVAAKTGGAAGRAKMTLRNLLATNVRKSGEVIALDKSKHAITIAKPAVSGAAAKQHEKKVEEAAAAQG